MKRHADPELAVLSAAIVDPDDVRMAQPCGDIGFAGEPHREVRVIGQLRAEQLEGIRAG
jgi:hypothetical protein